MLFCEISRPRAVQDTLFVLLSFTLHTVSLPS